MPAAAKKANFRLLAVAWVAAIIGLSTLPAAAQQSASTGQITDGITVSPAFKELSLGSGLIEANSKVVLTNHTKLNFVAKLRAVDFSELNDAGGISFGQAGQQLSKYGLAKWMELPGGDQIGLPAGQDVTVPVNIRNLSDMAPVGHYGALVVTVSPPDTGGSNRISFRQEVVSLFFVKKLGGEHYGLKLEKLTPDEKSAVPASVSLRFRSTGNVHVVPRGYVTVTDPAGKLVAKGIINPESTMVLPGNSRSFEALLTPLGNTSQAGRYKLTAYYRHDGQTGYDQQSVYFTKWSLSWLLLLGFVITGVIALILFRQIRRQRR